MQKVNSKIVIYQDQVNMKDRNSGKLNNGLSKNKNSNKTKTTTLVLAIIWLIINSTSFYTKSQKISIFDYI